MSNNGWNRPAANEPKVTKKSEKKFSLLHGLIAGAVVVVLGFAVLAILSGGDNEPKAKADKERGRIKEVTPAAAPTNKVATAAKKKKVEIKKVGGGLVMKYVDGKEAWLYPRRNDEAKWGVVTTSVLKADAPLYMRIFRHPTDVQIGMLLDYTPGDPFGDGLDTSNFTYLFLESLKDPEIVTKDDSEEAKELKRAVNEVKADLKARYDAGENLDDFIKETIKTYQELGQYREEVDKEIEKLSHDPEVTKEEMKQFIDAANEMLRKKGINSAKVPGSIWKRIERNQKRFLIQQKN